MAWKIELGNSVVYGICDGSVARDPLEYLLGSTPDDWATHADALDQAGQMVNSFTCYLFDTGSELVLIDTGFGANAPEGMAAGFMPDELTSIGVSASDIRHVVFTHLHPDHVLGSLDANQDPFFVNATHWTLKREVDHWRSTDDQRAPRVLSVVEVLEGAGVLNPTDEPTPVLPGVERIATYGHSPGHTSIRLSGGGDEVIVTGDLTWTPVQVDHPEWTSPFDGDPAEAAATRARFLDEVTASGTPFLAGHHPQPGFGRIVSTSDGRRYEALPVLDG